MCRWMPLALRYGKIARMAEPAPDPDPKLLLREDLSKEYYAILNVVSSYDGWLLIVKGWSVTLSLAALGLGFQQKHFALFALAAVTGAAFWFLDGLMKGYQHRYYVRMREIEYTAYLINRFPLGGQYRDREISAPRIDMTWDFKGYPVDKDTHKPLPLPQPWWRRVLARARPWWRRVLRHAEEPKPAHDGSAEEPKPGHDWRADEPWRRSPEEIYSALRGRFWLANVALPHAVGVVLGAALFIAAVLNAPGLEQLHL